MTRLSKIPAKIAFSLCTLFCLWPCFAFSQDVDTAWVRRYNGPGNGDDKAVAIAVDDSGNVYVTGSSFDSATGYDFCTIKYLPNGDTTWVRRFDGPASQNDYAVSIALAVDGGIYVLGTVTDTITNPADRFNSALVKYSSQGDILWVRFTYRILPDSATALTVDISGNVYVAGTMYLYIEEGIPTYRPALLEAAKYSSNGDVLWEVGWGYCPFSSARDIDVDVDGNVYVTGTENLAPFCEFNIYDFYYVTIKFDSVGRLLWVRYYNGGSNDFARSVAVDEAGNAFVTGNSGNDYATIKYDSGGNQLWVKRSNSTVEGGYGASFVATDNEDNVYVVGNRWFIPDFIAWVTIKYDSGGNQLWYQEYNGIDLGMEREPKGMTLDNLRNLYITGYDAGYVVTIKYDPEGNLLWEKRYGDDIYDYGTVGNAIAVDGKENVYVTGSTKNDFATIKYSPLPQIKGDLNLDGALSVEDVIYSVNYIFSGVLPPAAPAACDINCDGRLSGADIVTLLRMVFASAPAPC